MVWVGKGPPPTWLQELGVAGEPIDGKTAGALQVVQDLVFKKLIPLISPPLP